MKKRSLAALAFVAVLAVCTPLFAHHGAAAYDMSSPVVLKGAVVTQYRWINPHPLIVVDFKDDKGQTQHWTTEMGSTPASELIGWSHHAKAGDVITIYIWRSKTGVNVGRLNKIVLADGTTMRDTQQGADGGGRADTDVGR